MRYQRDSNETAIIRGIVVAVIAAVVIMNAGMVQRGRAATLGMGQVLWSVNIGNIGTSPNPPAIGDVDGDGVKEIMISSASNLYCISSSGTIKWAKSLGVSLSMPVLAQADQDKALEIFVYGSSTLFCLKGNGSIKWQASVPNTIVNKLAIADVDQDNISEIFLSTSNNRIYCYSGNNGTMKWCSPVTMNVASPLIAGASADGSDLLYAGSTNGTLTCMYARNGSIRWTTTFNNTTITPLAACDVKGDGTIGVFVKTSTLACIYGVNGSVMWQLPAQSSPIDMAVTGDVNRDGRMEIVTASSSAIVCFLALTGQQLWKSSSSYKGGTIQIADINYDHEWEICFIRDGDIVGLRGNNGTTIWDEDLYSSFVSGHRVGILFLYTFALSDVNDDGVLEIVYYYHTDTNTLKSHEIHYILECAQLFGASWMQSPSWSSIAGSVLHTNAYQDPDHDGVSTSMENVIGTNPFKNDTDGDGVADGEEINCFTNPMDASKQNYALSMNRDSDPISDEWPMFRGQLNHTGVATTTPVQMTGPMWSYTTGSCVESSLAVRCGRVFVGSMDNKVYCLNATTGAIVWSYPTGDWVRSSPAVAGGLVYVGSWDGILYCLNATTGVSVWSYTTGWYVFSSPAVVGGRVYVGSYDDKVYCLNATTGALVWSYSTGSLVFSSPTVSSGRVYVGSDDNKIYCLNATTGILLWFYTTGDLVASSPAVAGGRVYVGSYDGNLYCLDAITGALAWLYTTSGSYNHVFSSPAVAGGHVYVGSFNGNLYCLNATTGAFVWYYTTNHEVWSSPAIAGGRVYFGGEDNKVYCLPMIFIPSTPQTLQASGGKEQVTLTWQEPMSTGGLPIINYKIYRGTSTGCETFLTTVGNVLAYMDTNVTDGLAYYYTISAVNVNGEGSRSSEVVAIPSAVPPSPLNLQASSERGQVTLTWQSPLSNGRSPITNYTIYRGTSMGNEAFYIAVGNLTSYTDTSVLNTQTYYYKVSAVNDAGEGAMSNEVSSRSVEDFNNWANGQTITGEASGEHVHWVTASNYGGCTFYGSSMVISSGNSGRIYDAYDASSSDWIYACAEYDTPSPQTPSVTNQYLQAIDIEITANSLSQVYMSQVLGYPGSSATVCVSFATNGSLTVITPSNKIGTGLTWSLNTKYTLVMQCLSASMSRFSLDGGNKWTQAFLNVGNWTGPVKEMCLYTGAAATCTAYVDNICVSWTQAMMPTTPAAPRSLSVNQGNGQVVLNWTAPTSNGSSPITGYRIYRGTTSGGETLLATIGNVLSYTSIGLTNGQVYYFKVQAENDNGMGANSTEACATPATIPTAPQALTATPFDKQVTLTWIKPPSNGGSAITNYRIYQGNASNGEIILATIGNVTSYTATGLANGQVYYFKIVAVNAIGSGANSTEVSAEPIAVPSAPQNFTAVAGNGQVMLNWAAPESIYKSEITAYRIYQGLASGAEMLQMTIGNVTNCTMTSLTNGQVYYFKVAAVNATGMGAYSAEINATPATVPTAPQSLTATAGNAQVVLNWLAPASNGGSPICGYRIYCGTTFSDETLIAALGVVMTYTATGLTNGKVYYFKVQAVNANGCGANSTEMSATLMTVPGAPTGFTATPTIGQVMLSWATPASNGGSAIMNYRVYQHMPSGSEIYTTVGAVLNYTWTGLTYGYCYCFQVTAMNMMGESARSTEIDSGPSGPSLPGVPTGLTATPGNAQVVLNWAAPASNGGSAIQGYRIYRSLTSGTEALLASVPLVLNYTNTGLTNGQLYYYKIAAVNAVGTSANSTEASATPVPTVPTVPQAFTVTAGNGQLILRWDAPASNGGSCIIGYDVYQGTIPGGETLCAILGDVSNYTVMDLTNGCEYNFKIAAWNVMGIGMNSIEICSVPIMESNTTNAMTFATPGMPLNLRATVANLQVTLSWQSPASNGGCSILNYSIYRATISGNETFLVTIGNVTSYMDTNVSNDQAYYYAVSAINIKGEGMISVEIMATPKDGDSNGVLLPGKPTPPSSSSFLSRPMIILVSCLLLAIGFVMSLSTMVVARKIRTRHQYTMKNGLVPTSPHHRGLRNKAKPIWSNSEIGQRNDVRASATVMPGVISMLDPASPVRDIVSSIEKVRRLMQFDIAAYTEQPSIDDDLGFVPNIASIFKETSQYIDVDNSQVITEMEELYKPMDLIMYEPLDATSTDVSRVDMLSHGNVLRVENADLHPDPDKGEIDSYSDGHGEDDMLALICSDCTVSIEIMEWSDFIMHTCNTCQKPMEVLLYCKACFTMWLFQVENGIQTSISGVKCPVCHEKIWY